jgi:hypothetical protein
VSSSIAYDFYQTLVRIAVPVVVACGALRSRSDPTLANFETYRSKYQCAQLERADGILEGSAIRGAGTPA